MAPYYTFFGLNAKGQRIVTEKCVTAWGVDDISDEEVVTAAIDFMSKHDEIASIVIVKVYTDVVLNDAKIGVSIFPTVDFIRHIVRAPKKA